MKYVCDVCGWEYDEEKGYLLQDPHLYQLPVLLLHLWQVTSRCCFQTFRVLKLQLTSSFFPITSVTISCYNVNLFHL